MLLKAADVVLLLKKVLVKTVYVIFASITSVFIVSTSADALVCKS